ncbi:GL18515 [Drosophila persimilis]|uniref:GL18515 n=1 Tax=Drosophila persimilis TaxID=7234 RepID=B4G746_DROPE|nr:GL18515 [Drosophila persimilis]
MLYLLVKILNCLDEALLRPLAYVINNALFFLGLLDDLGKVVLWVILLLPRAIIIILDYILAFVVHSILARCLSLFNSLFNSLFRISIVVALLLVLYMFRRYVYLLLNYQLQRARTEISEKTQSAYLWTERQLNRISRSGSSKANDGARPSSGSCVVCMERRTNIVILPCRHLCLCAECSVQVQAYMDMRDHCPICREFIDGYLHVYV